MANQENHPWLEKKLKGSYFRLKKSLQAKAEVNKRTQSRPVFAGVGIRLEPRPKDYGYVTTLELNHQDVDDFDQKNCIEAAFQGVIDTLWTHHIHPIRDVEIFLTFFSYDKPQSAHIVFWEAARNATRIALTHPGGVGLTEDPNFELVSRG